MNETDSELGEIHRTGDTLRSYFIDDSTGRSSRSGLR